MILCYVTDRHLLDESNSLDLLLQSIERAAAAGVDLIHIREKDLTARELVEFTRRAIVAVHREAKQRKAKPARIIVNDRLDVALAAEAAGVHLSSTSIPAAETVQWLKAGNAPADFTVGVSCHSLAEALAAEQAGANYIFFGPVYDTPSKAAFGKPQGVEKLAEVCRSIRIPVLAIGGVTETNAPECARAGAAGIAAIRLFQQTLDPAAPAATVSRLRTLR
jgi:thiamine-phosphate pyrophosphorylase